MIRRRCVKLKTLLCSDLFTYTVTPEDYFFREGDMIITTLPRLLYNFITGHHSPGLIRLLLKMMVAEVMIYGEDFTRLSGTA